MSLKNKQIKVNETNKIKNTCVYFFADHKKVETNKKIDKKLKSSKATKYSTVFMVDKDTSLLVTDEEIEIKINNKQLETETLKDAHRAVEKQKKKQTKWLNILFLIVNLLVVVGILIYQLNNMGVAPIDKLITFNFSFIIYSLLIFAIIMLIESFRTYILIYKVTKTSRPILSYKASAISRYYDCATPFSTGGQPFEVFYLNNRGVSGGPATSVPLAKSLFQSVAFVIVSLVILICGSHLFGDDAPVVKTWGIISLVIAIVIILAVILFSVSKKIVPKITMFILKLLHKCKIVKNYNLAFNKCMRTMFEYQKSMKFYVKSFWIMLTSMICSGLIVVLKAIIPLIIYCAFNATITEATVIEIFSKFILIELATKYIPLPGGSGVAEISFSALFSSLFNDGTLFWAMLFYRIFNYFIYLLQGLIVIIYDFIYGNKKNKKQIGAKTNELPNYEKREG